MWELTNVTGANLCVGAMAASNKVTTPQIESDAARTPESEKQSQSTGELDMPAPHVQVERHLAQADTSSGSGSSPYVPAEGAATGSQSGSLGSAPVSRSPADGPEQPAAHEQLQQPERLRVPQLDLHSEQELTPSSLGGVAVHTVREVPESPEPPGWQAYVAHSEQLRLSCLDMWSRVEAMQQKMVQTEQSLADERDRHATTVDDYRKCLATLSLELSLIHI